jgi:alpha-beta hydrolase superfamily lysophospholipase
METGIARTEDSHADDVSGARPQAAAPHETEVRTADGIDLYARAWLPPSRPRAAIALVHGLAEHCCRYDALARRLNAAGIALVAIDLRGHGRSPGRRVWVERFDDYLLDADALVEHARATLCRTGVPLFLMGHSMGGAIAALYALERAPARAVPLDGLILSSPALAMGDDIPRWMIALGSVLSRITPWLPIRRIDPSLLARDAAVVAANRDDPLVHHGGMPARTGAEILRAMERIASGRASLALPTLVFHGADDKLTEPDGSRDFAAHAGNASGVRPTLRIYEGSYHETMNDLDRDQVIDALIAWVNGRLGTGSAIRAH